MARSDFNRQFMRLNETDPEGKQLLTTTVQLFQAKSICEPTAVSGDRVTQRGRNGVEVWPACAEEKKAVFIISRELFVRFFWLVPYAEVRKHCE